MLDQLFRWFENPGHAAGIAALFTFLALFVSLAALLKVHLRDRRAAIENRKARLYCEALDGRLWIHNRFTGEARGIEIQLDDKPICQHPVMLHGANVPKLLGPLSSTSCPIGRSIDVPSMVRVNVIWLDDSGEEGRYRSILNA